METNNKEQVKEPQPISDDKIETFKNEDIKKDINKDNTDYNVDDIIDKLNKQEEEVKNKLKEDIKSDIQKENELNELKKIVNEQRNTIKDLTNSVSDMKNTTIEELKKIKEHQSNRKSQVDVKSPFDSKPVEDNGLLKDLGDRYVLNMDDKELENDFWEWMGNKKK